MRTWLMAIALMLVASPALAQAEARPELRAERAMRGPMLGQIENALRLRSQLELSETQVRQLDELRREQLDRQAAREETRRDLMSRMRAGMLERGEADRTLFEQREAMRAETDRVGSRFDEILTEDQRARLRERRVAVARGWMEGRRREMRAPRMWAPSPRARVMPPRGMRAPRAVPAPRAPRFFDRRYPGAWWRERE